MYATLQAAHNAAANGDIIYVEGSGTEYAGATLTKKLTIIGPGYFLGENYNYFPDLRAATFGPYEDIIFNAGSEGSSLTGCSGIDVIINVSNITISRNTDFSVYLSGTTPLVGILISKNYGVRPYDSYSVGVNVVITNNYITSTSGLNKTSFSGTFSNNIIGGSISLNNFTVSNNILLSSAPSFTNCTFSNNIDARALANSTAFGTTNGNLGNVDKNTLFAGATGNSTDGQWKLKAGSVAIGAGYNGVDCGIYGGLDHYELSGITSAEYPTITSFTTSGSGNNSTPLTVKISTK